MRLIAKWHIWLGWLAGVPLLLWTVSGLVMIAKPIEEVRGEHLRVDAPEPPLQLNRVGPIPTEPGLIMAARIANQDGKPIWLVEFTDGHKQRYAIDGVTLPAISESEAKSIVASQIVGGDRVVGTRSINTKDEVPLDLRKPVPAWQITLADHTHVYVARDSGEIVAVRTRWWRVYDFFWGLHIMDLQTRENLHHPLLIGFTVLALLSTVLGTTLLFRRRKARGPSR